MKTKRQQIESAIELWIRETHGPRARAAMLTDCIFAILVEPTETMLSAGNAAALDTAVLMDDRRFACERATWDAMVRGAFA